MMLTVTIQISNSDNKLTQGEWAEFCNTLQSDLERIADKIHFQGGSSWNAPWQNACWVCGVARERLDELKSHIRDCRAKFLQDSAAVTAGEAEFI